MQQKKRYALIPGSFDPVTLGHESLIRRAAHLFDRVFVVLFCNPDKAGRFSHAQRLSFLRAVCQKYPNVTVDEDDGMVVDYVKRHGISAIVKGVRNAEDLAYEYPQAVYNRDHSGVETLLLIPEEGTEEISSTAVRTALSHGDIPKELLPAEILPLLGEKLGFDGKKIDK